MHSNLNQPSASTHRKVCWLLVAFIATFFLSVSIASAFESRAPRAYLYDVNTRTVLYAQNAEERFAPASMAKTLVAAVVFDLLNSGQLSPDQMIDVSEDAWRRGGAPSGRATMFAEINSQVAVEDLVRGLIVMSANDAAIALAQGIDGTEDVFALRMSTMATQMGAADTAFSDSTGLSDPGTYTTVRDLVVMANALIQDDPANYTYFSEPDFTWNGIFQRNRNPLIREITGLDGLFAGFADEAGYGAVGSVVREGRRIVFAVSGLDTAEGRIDEAERLVRHAFDDFRTVRVAERDEPVAQARVHGGHLREIDLIASDGALDILLPREGEERVRARIVYDQPVPAPIAQGTPIARLLVERDGTIIQDTPLVAAQNVDQGSMIQRARDGFIELVFGWIPPISFAGTF